MKKKLIAAAVILFFGSAAVAGTWQASKILGVLLALVLLAVLAAILGAFKLLKKPAAPAPEVDAPAFVPTEDSEKTGAFDFEYVRVGLFRPKDIETPMPPVGASLEFEEEPDNPYDSEAIVATYEGEKVGYLNKGKLRETVRRGLDEYAPMQVTVSRADERLEVYIGIDRV